MNYLNDIDVLVLGLGDSGLAMARWCARHGARVRVWDSREAAPQDAALAESLPLKLNDNLRVGLATLVACEQTIGGDPHALRMLVVGSIVYGLISLWRRRRPVPNPQG